MPITPTYPGVYIEEIPSTVRTIVGVPTAVTAFVGRALRGPVDDPIVIHSYADFERIFGGLWAESTLGYAVRDFYLNAPGGRAILVRVAPGAEPALITAGNLELAAKSPGAWGKNLRVRVDHDTKEDPNDSTLFNLTVAEVLLDPSKPNEPGKVLREEKIRNLSVMPNSPRRVDKILAKDAGESMLVVYAGAALPTARPEASPPAKDAEHPDAPPLWGDNPTSVAAAPDTAAEGDVLTSAAFLGGEGDTFEKDKKGLYALERADIFNLLSIPPYTHGGSIDQTLIDAAITLCERRRAMFLIDPPADWTTKELAKARIETAVGAPSPNAALYFPRLRQPNPLRDNVIEEFVPSGAVAGVIARTDAERGVWKAPAGMEARLVGVPDLTVQLTEAEIGELNPLGINALRSMPAAGRVVWGARTREGNDRLASQWKYIPVRRLALFLEESMYRGTQWAVFEPNDEPLWAAIRLNLGVFMHSLFRQGAFQGATPNEAYLVKCDSDTTTQDDINRGIVNVIIGFAPLKPAEFVILKIQQLAGQIQA